MTDTLFDLPFTPSPIDEWMLRHGVSLTTCLSTYDMKAESHKNIYRKGYGETPEEALTDFAIKNNLKLWNEE